MIPKVTIEVDAKHEAVVRQALAMCEEMEQLALTAVEGTVLHACEEAVIEKGRRLQSQVLADAVTRRIEIAEKKATARKTARNIRDLDVYSRRVGPIDESTDGMEGWQDALFLARGYGFRSLGTRCP